MLTIILHAYCTEAVPNILHYLIIAKQAFHYICIYKLAMLKIRNVSKFKCHKY